MEGARLNGAGDVVLTHTPGGQELDHQTRKTTVTLAAIYTDRTCHPRIIA